MSNENKPVPPQKNIVTLRQAKRRTRYWREAIKSIYGDNPDNMPHGFYIRMEDIQELAKLHTHFPTREIKGVRVYFSLHKPLEPGKATTAITGLFVPVYDATTEGKPGEEESPSRMKKQNLKDLVQAFPHSGDDGDLLNQYVSVYDVTTPCPPVCDPTSPMFGPVTPDEEDDDNI
jgi:hypothetical protein